MVFAVVACVAQAFAARNIVYVSFNGSDANACTVAAPCKTISHALTVVAAGGEVDIISSGTYDNFIVNKAVTVAAAPGVLASSDVPANTNGITIAAGASDIVNLRNLHLNGLGSFATAIQVNSLGQLNMEDCIVRNLRDGISFTPGNTSSTLRINGGILDLAVTPYTGFSIYTESGGNMNVDRVNVYNGVPDAISVQQQNSVFTVTRSFLIGCGGCSGSGFDTGSGIDIIGSSTPATGVAEDNVISNFGNNGVATFNGSTAYVSSNTITGNGVGIVNAFTRGDNTVETNTTNEAGTLTPFNPQ